MCENPAESTADSGDPPPPADPALRAELVTANRILARYGVVDAFGHISVRHPAHPGRFLLARNLAPALVTAEDLLTFDLDGRPLDAGGRRVYLERFIHGEILRRRPDVRAVVHSHAPAVIPFGIAAGATLRPVWHMSFFLAAGAPLFEIRETAGDASDLLISSAPLGRALAEALGAQAVVLMRGHGATVVGASIREAVYRAVYTQLNAELQQRALLLAPGAVEYLSAGEARAAAATVGSQIDRAWALWAHEVAAGAGQAGAA